MPKRIRARINNFPFNKTFIIIIPLKSRYPSIKCELPLLGVDSREYDDEPNELTYSTPMGRGKPLKSTGSGGGGGE